MRTCLFCSIRAFPWHLQRYHIPQPRFPLPSLSSTSFPLIPDTLFANMKILRNTSKPQMFSANYRIAKTIIYVKYRIPKQCFYVKYRVSNENLALLWMGYRIRHIIRTGLRRHNTDDCRHPRCRTLTFGGQKWRRKSNKRDLPNLLTRIGKSRRNFFLMSFLCYVRSTHLSFMSDT